MTLRDLAAPEPRPTHGRPTDVTVEQRRRLTAVTAVLMLLTAGLILTLSITGTVSSPRVLAVESQHHLTVPSPIRSASQHVVPSIDAMLLSPTLLLGIALLVWLRRRPEARRAVAPALARPSARAPPRMR